MLILGAMRGERPRHDVSSFFFYIQGSPCKGVLVGGMWEHRGVQRWLTIPVDLWFKSHLESLLKFLGRDPVSGSVIKVSLEKLNFKT